MNITGEFLQKYQQQVLEKVLPPVLQDLYKVVSCLKSDKSRDVFLLVSSDGHRLILKTQVEGKDEALKNEFGLLENLTHKGLTKAVCYLVADGMEYFIREYAEGVSLFDYVRENSALSEEKSLTVWRELCGILRYLHNQSPPIIHRDIKPQNVILSPDGSCKLIDFGTARSYKEQETGDTVFMGTQVTAPPEQFGYRQTDTRSDIYSLGVLMRFMLTGSFDLKVPITASAGLKKIIARCTAFDPKNRFGSVGQLERCLTLGSHKKTIWGITAAALSAILLLSAGYVWQQANRSVQFTNPLLAQAVRQELNLSQYAPIPRSRLAEVGKIIICRQDVGSKWSMHGNDHRSTIYNNWPDIRGSITDISELSLLSNLASLVLDYQQIEDISPLTKLPLTQLSLSGNHIADITPLKSCTKLTALRMDENPIANSASLAGLTALRELNISNTYITDTSCIGNLPLEELTLQELPLCDFTPLTNLKWLKYLTVRVKSPEQLTAVQSITSLEELLLRCEVPVCLGDFEGTSNLRRLDTAGSSLIGASAAGVEKLARLTCLNLSQMEYLDSLEPLTAMPALTRVELHNSSVADFSPLLRCKNLQSAMFSDTQQEQVERQLQGAPFQIEYWDNHS